jgi:hypothetical protein
VASHKLGLSRGAVWLALMVPHNSSSQFLIEKGAALGLTARRMHISPVSFVICRGSLTLTPSRGRSELNGLGAGIQIPTVDSTGLAVMESRTVKTSDRSVE